MIRSHKHNANVGLLIGLMGVAITAALKRERETEALAGIVACVAFGFYTWGCVQYAKAKGHPGWVGAVGLVGLIGLLVLFFLDDRDAEGAGVARADERYLFPSDDRVGRRAAPKRGLDSNTHRREFLVRFGSALAVDGFGFVRNGRVTLTSDTLIYQGPRHWLLLARLGAFVAVTVGLWFLVALLAPIIALALVHYFATFEGQLEIQRAALRRIALRGRKLTFEAVDPASGAYKVSILRLESDEHAAELAQLLELRPLAHAA